MFPINAPVTAPEESSWPGTHPTIKDRQSKQVVVVADSSKIGMVRPVIIWPANKIDVLITDEGIPEDAVAAFKDAGVQVLCV